MEPNEDNFEQLRKLLELKRHEGPPPGYFEDLPGGIIARIEAEDARGASAWWRRFIPGFDTSPAMVGAYGVIVASLVVVGVQLAGRATPGGEPADLQPGNALAISEPGTADDPAASLQPAMAPANLPIMEPASLAVFHERETNSSSAPTGMFATPSLNGTTTVERAAFPANR